MGQIQQETAAEIWKCYREIETAGKLLCDLAELKEKFPDDPHAQHLRDGFGRMQNLQLGIPMGDTCHRLFDVSPRLALAVIKTHIAEKEAELMGLNEKARIELESGDTC